MKVKNRIKKAEEFQSMIKKGAKIVNQSFVIYYGQKDDDEARIGISVSKKLGNAVHRNLYKRQVRMMCHELIDFKNTNHDLVLIVRFNYSSLSYEENKNNLEKLLIKAKIK
mgnify:FL=1